MIIFKTQLVELPICASAFGSVTRQPGICLNLQLCIKKEAALTRPPGMGLHLGTCFIFRTTRGWASRTGSVWLLFSFSVCVCVYVL